MVELHLMDQAVSVLQFIGIYYFPSTVINELMGCFQIMDAGPWKN